MTSISSSQRMRMSEEKARSWLNSIDPENLEDLGSVLESIADSSIVDSSDSESDNLTGNLEDEERYNDISKLPKYKEISNWDCIQDQFLSRLPPPSFGSITINNSNNVVLGNIIKIRGDLIINVKNDKDIDKSIRKDNDGEGHNEVQNNGKMSVNEKQNLGSKKSVYRPACLIVPRARWLAMDPVDDYIYLQEPLDLVIISHTASDSSTEQSGNIGIIRSIQAYHIGTQEWDDIGYNFLVGCDGNVYEGRGWGVQGVHTYRYNNRSIGISFIGCFLSKLPTTRALEACKKLLQRGVDEGHLSAKFKLLGHRQCISTESPGRKLFAEIKTWDNFYDKDDLDELNEKVGA